jgi:hypothetical protein
MSARSRLSAGCARAFARGAPARSTGLGAGTGAGAAGSGSPRLQSRRAYRALSRAAMRARPGARATLRQPRAACPAMLDLFLHAWDEFDDT